MQRQKDLNNWVNQYFADQVELTPLSGDAGFRHYYRCMYNQNSYIVVDSPKQFCNNSGFYWLSLLFARQGILVPEIYAYDENNGFFVLQDLGDELFSECIAQAHSNNLVVNSYHQAIDLLSLIQQSKADNNYLLPKFDRNFVTTELNIFTEWLLDKHLALFLSDLEKRELDKCFEFLIQNALEQPQVVMHRDFHSRNLMYVGNKLATIDYQDAVLGPICYDIVSLLRDCYIRLPRAQVFELFDYYLSVLQSNAKLSQVSKLQWQRWFDLIGLQRHLKASGIFARLHHRDNKSAYLSDIPLTLSYIVEVSSNYPELQFLQEFVEQKVQPKLGLVI